MSRKRTIFLIVLTNSLFCVTAQTKGQLQQRDSICNDSIWKSEVLDSVVVKGSMVVHDHDKDVWTITDEMRQRTYDTNELLGKIQGFFYNRATRSLSFMGRDNIRFLINGIEKEADYVGMLANKRFKKIEITQHPTGRYQEYDVVVNLITKTGWLGYEGSLLGSLNSGSSKEKTEAYPRSSFSFTSPRVDASVNYLFRHKDELRNVSMTMKEQEMLQYNTLDDKKSKDYSQTNIHYAWADADYKINKKHTVSFKYAFVWQDDNQNSNYLMEKFDISQHTSQLIKRFSRDNVQRKFHAFSVYYRGNYKGWNLYSDATYSYQHDYRHYDFSEQGYQTSTYTDNTYNVLKYNVDANINLSKKSKFNVGFQGTYRNLTDGLSDNRQEMSYRSLYSRIYAKLSHRFSPHVSGDIGGVAEYSHSRSFNEQTDHQLLWGGNAQLRFRTLDNKLSANLNYRYQLTYPSVMQLSVVRRTLDSLMVSSGKADLKRSANHYLSASIYYSKFGLWAVVNHNGNHVAPVYKTSEGKIWQTYDNMKRSSLRLMAFYKDEIKWKNASLVIDMNASYETASLKYASERKSTSWMEATCGLTYQHDKWGDFTINYLLQPRKTLTFQSSSYTYKKDGFEVAYGKSFLNEKLLFQLNYHLPFKWAADYESYSNTYTPAYTREYAYDSYSAQKNMLSLVVIYRFAHGRQVRKLNNQQATAE